MQNLVDTSDLSEQQIQNILTDAKSFKQQLPTALLRDKLLITLFFENSTRTRSSFEVAAKRLGAMVVHLDPSRSSTNKGESLHDTFENLCAMEPDGVIIRHEYNNTPRKLADKGLTSILNAGAGNYAHPTQALLDYFTMVEHFGDVRGKTIAIVGDVVSSRVASSGIRLFVRMGMRVVLVAPGPFMPDNDLEKFEHLEEIIDEVDIIMSLRAQLERHKAPIFEDYDEYAREYCINKERLGERDVLLLHPGPVMRNIDISDEMLEDPRCKVLEQVKNGVFVRMAILKCLLLDA
ncbi:MAG: aspartate carbamoyltransferase catalytic subunit [Epsilonproteobacteria bacterium]|nr:aspartate carbamoyltransferase catalytic subunit [Campylobacterota bacterium]